MVVTCPIGVAVAAEAVDAEVVVVVMAVIWAAVLKEDGVAADVVGQDPEIWEDVMADVGVVIWAAMEDTEAAVEAEVVVVDHEAVVATRTLA